MSFVRAGSLIAGYVAAALAMSWLVPADFLLWVAPAFHFIVGVVVGRIWALLLPGAVAGGYSVFALVSGCGAQRCTDLLIEITVVAGVLTVFTAAGLILRLVWDADLPQRSEWPPTWPRRATLIGFVVGVVGVLSLLMNQAWPAALIVLALMTAGGLGLQAGALGVLVAGRGDRTARPRRRRERGTRR